MTGSLMAYVLGAHFVGMSPRLIVPDVANNRTYSAYSNLAASGIASRSLGALASPWRIFDLSDVGGLIRIDGMDAYLDGFDDQPGEEG